MKREYISEIKEDDEQRRKNDQEYNDYVEKYQDNTVNA